MLRGAGRRPGPGLLPELHPLRLDHLELHYGQQISRLAGGAHFVVNTGSNGRGPLRARNRVRHGNEVLCNPPGRGLGPLSVADDVAQQTAYAATDGLLWFSNPGGSGGQCVPGAPPTGVFWPAYAVMLARNWVDQVTGPKFDLLGSPFAARRTGRNKPSARARTARRAVQP